MGKTCSPGDRGRAAPRLAGVKDVVPTVLSNHARRPATSHGDCRAAAKRAALGGGVLLPCAGRRLLQCAGAHLAGATTVPVPARLAPVVQRLANHDRRRLLRICAVPLRLYRGDRTSRSSRRLVPGMPAARLAGLLPLHALPAPLPPHVAPLRPAQPRRRRLACATCV